MSSDVNAYTQYMAVIEARKTTWRKLLEEAFKTTGDSFDGLICTLTDEQLDARFDAYEVGPINGQPFTAWSNQYVYFSADEDGAEYVDWLLRHPPEFLKLRYQHTWHEE